MTENPYQAPQATATAVGVLSGSRDDLRSVAKCQKGILVCILIYLVAMFGQFALPPDVRPLVGLAVLIVGLVGAVFVFMLAIKVYGTGLGIVLGVLSLVPLISLIVLSLVPLISLIVLSLVPLISLIVLLVVNGKATGILKQNGIKVGLLGANTAAI